MKNREDSLDAQSEGFSRYFHCRELTQPGAQWSAWITFFILRTRIEAARNPTNGQKATKCSDIRLLFALESKSHHLECVTYSTQDGE
jgi:hypothetical protein